MKPVNNIIFIDDDIMSNLIHEKIAQTISPQMQISSYLDSVVALSYLKQIAKTNLEKFPDIIFLDLNMPEMDGWEFLEELNRLKAFSLKNCKVYMVTSSIDHGDIEKAKSHKMVHDFISKPLTNDKLYTLISPRNNTTTKSMIGLKRPAN